MVTAIRAIQNRERTLHNGNHILGKQGARIVDLAAKEGFTLVEMIVVVAIIAILAAIAIPSYAAYIRKARIDRCIAEIMMMQQGIVTYTTDNGRQPDSLNDIGQGNVKDPWGSPYQYLNIADGGMKGNGKLRKDRFVNPLNSDYDLYSMGEDGNSKLPLTAKESQDDIIRANNGGFIGLASDF